MNIEDFQQESVQERLAEENWVVSSWAPEPGRGPFIVVNGLVVIPVFRVHKYSPRNDVYEIPISYDHQEVGSLCLMSMIGARDDVLSALTANQYASYLALVSQAGFLNGDFPSFSQDCVVINQANIEAYWANKESSAVWGGFCQIEGSMPIAEGEIESSTASIVIRAGCKARTPRHLECLMLAAKSSRATERFLHLYHYLELDYDYEVVRAIKSIDENDPRSLWDVLKSQKDEFERIIHVVSGYSDFAKLESLFLELRNHEAAATRLFYEYGKDSNPLKSQDAFDKQFIKSPIISRPELDKIKRDENLQDNFAAKDDEYRKKLIRLSCYWVYRVRCSIAHNKLGEYYLNKTDDMDLVVKFVEPLLIELIAYRMASHA